MRDGSFFLLLAIFIMLAAVQIGVEKTRHRLDQIIVIMEGKR